MTIFFSKLERVLAYFVGFLMALMVVDVTWQVITRFIMSQPSSYTEELARFLLVWISLLGAAYAYRTRAHLGLDILVTQFNVSVQKWIALFIEVVCLFFAVVILLYGGLKLVMLTLELNQTSAALQVKMGYVYCALPISGVLIALFSLERIFTSVSNIAGDSNVLAQKNPEEL